MKISVLGTGTIGRIIAKKLVKAGYKVSIANSRGIKGAKKLAKELGAEAKDYETISKDADILIISTLFEEVPKLPKNIFNDLPKSSIIIDTMNYHPDVRKVNFDESKPESVWISEQVGRKVIKTFNNVLAYTLDNLGKAKDEKNRIAMQVAGDDEEQKKVVMKLIEDCGFEPYDNGNLENSWTQQPYSAGYCCDYTCEELKEIKEKSKQTKKSIMENRKEIIRNFAKLIGGDYSHENLIKVNRKYNI